MDRSVTVDKCAHRSSLSDVALRFPASAWRRAVAFRSVSVRWKSCAVDHPSRRLVFHTLNTFPQLHSAPDCLYWSKCLIQLLTSQPHRILIQ